VPRGEVVCRDRAAEFCLVRPRFEASAARAAQIWRNC